MDRNELKELVKDYSPSQLLEAIKTIKQHKFLSQEESIYLRKLYQKRLEEIERRL